MDAKIPPKPSWNMGELYIKLFVQFPLVRFTINGNNCSVYIKIPFCSNSEVRFYFLHNMVT